MARLTRMISIREKDEVDKELSTCFFCSKTISKGGCWAGKYHIGVCKECSHYLVDLLLDTLYDTDEAFRKSSVEDKSIYLKELTDPIIIKKEERRIEMDEYEKIKKLKLKYYSEIGIIDYFECTMTSEQMVDNLDEYSEYTAEDIYGCEEEIKKSIEEKTGERPHTVRYFGIPDNSYGMFRVACVAKISNNGSTFVFSSDRDYFESTDFAGYHNDVDLVY